MAELQPWLWKSNTWNWPNSAPKAPSGLLSPALLLPSANVSMVLLSPWSWHIFTSPQCTEATNFQPKASFLPCYRESLRLLQDNQLKEQPALHFSKPCTRRLWMLTNNTSPSALLCIGSRKPSRPYLVPSIRVACLSPGQGAGLPMFAKMLI